MSEKTPPQVTDEMVARAWYAFVWYDGHRFAAVETRRCVLLLGCALSEVLRCRPATRRRDDERRKP